MHVDWHPYPETKPTKKDRYLINLDDGNGHQYITIATFYKDTFWESGAIDHIVSAWAELPEPYNRRNNNDERRLAPSES